jgi:subtilisin family serine protease
MTRSLKISRALPASPAGSDRFYRDQWAWKKMEVENAWARIGPRAAQRIGAKPITVAIVDWGIQRNHEGFGPEMEVSGARVIPPDNGDFRDDDGHGTMLAGTIAGITNNISGSRGAVARLRLLAIKFVDVRTPPMSANAAKAIRYAVDKGARIINASWDVGLNSPELRAAIMDGGFMGVLVVVAAGNDGGNNDRYPAFPASFHLDNMIVVMATNEHDEKPWFSNYGRETVDIAAPGVNIVSTSPYLVPPSRHHPAYRRYSGTSPAAAHVSGAAALLLSVNPRLKPAEIRDRLIRSVDDQSEHGVRGLHRYCRAHGRLNVRKAICNEVSQPLNPG